ncbi:MULTISPECIES: ATP-binding protein [Actinokineospora]|uniref:Signal transduction histidine-protein kinase/phosphatase MprB n=1 Tax=Actinokineospora fastidiosa TaxID=1816 RepID=A0A918LAT4_9PSEU|nr:MULTISPECIES: ATP-binding protein [Actinokineospora]UVS81795.1 Signal transduction histidine-protein kinase BaeS [Actinokineospora sp. UTMC 2448]GGS25252.1 two-component sensor histidine kinase [Actinokineospora fastidiosa]
MRRRILLAIMLAVLVTACSLGIPLGYTALQIVEQITRDDLAARAQGIAARLDDEIANGRQVELRRVAVAVPVDGLLEVTLPSQPVRTIGTEITEEAVTEEVPMVQQGTVRLSVPAGPMRTRQTQVALLVALVIITTVGIGAVVAMVTARRIARPLRHVADRASRLGAGDFRLDSTRYDLAELDSVAEALDASATALAHLIQRERDLVGDVSHQLRSRLTALQLRLETLASVPDEETASEARAGLAQADRLAEVLDELLAAARVARAGGAEPVDLARELTAIAEEWRKPLRADGRTLRLRLQPNLIVRATPGRLREAIGVLLDNAHRHGGGTVTLTARVSGETVVVEVADNGPGVPDELAPHIFDRGVSGAGSTGLGLALARALVDSDGGRMELSTAKPATFSVFLRMPRAGDVTGVRWPAEKSPR